MGENREKVFDMLIDLKIQRGNLQIHQGKYAIIRTKQRFLDKFVPTSRYTTVPPQDAVKIDEGQKTLECEKPIENRSQIEAIDGLFRITLDQSI